MRTLPMVAFRTVVGDLAALVPVLTTIRVLA
jgi:hypothetical protein